MFPANVSLLYPLKIQENLLFFYVLTGYKGKHLTSAGNGLNGLIDITRYCDPVNFYCNEQMNLVFIRICIKLITLPQTL